MLLWSLAKIKVLDEKGMIEFSKRSQRGELDPSTHVKRHLSQALSESSRDSFDACFGLQSLVALDCPPTVEEIRHLLRTVAQKTTPAPDDEEADSESKSLGQESEIDNIYHGDFGIHPRDALSRLRTCANVCILMRPKFPEDLVSEVELIVTDAILSLKLSSTNRRKHRLLRGDVLVDDLVPTTTEVAKGTYM